MKSNVITNSLVHARSVQSLPQSGFRRHLLNHKYVKFAIFIKMEGHKLLLNNFFIFRPKKGYWNHWESGANAIRVSRVVVVACVAVRVHIVEVRRVGHVGRTLPPVVRGYSL